MNAKWKSMARNRTTRAGLGVWSGGRGGGAHSACVVGKMVGGGRGGICLMLNLPSVRNSTARLPNQAIHHIPTEIPSITQCQKADSGVALMHFRAAGQGGRGGKQKSCFHKKHRVSIFIWHSR